MSQSRKHHFEKSADASYEKFLKEGTVTFNPVVAPKYQPKIDDLFKKGQIAGLEFSTVKAIDKLIPGSALYAKPKLVAVSGAINTHQRVKGLLDNNVSKKTALTCGLAGALVEEGITLFGNAAVVGATGGLIAQSGGSALLPATALATTGFGLVGVGSQAVGDLSEKMCVKASEKLQALFQKTDTKSVRQNIFSSPTSTDMENSKQSADHYMRTGQVSFAAPKSNSLTSTTTFSFNRPTVKPPSLLPNKEGFKMISVKEERVRQVQQFHVSNKSDTNLRGDLIGLVFYDHNGKPEIDVAGEKIKEGYIVFCNPDILNEEDKSLHRQLFEKYLGSETKLENVTVSGFARQNGTWKRNSWTLNWNFGPNYTKENETTHDVNQMSDYEFEAVKKAAETYLDNTKKVFLRYEATNNFRLHPPALQTNLAMNTEIKLPAITRKF